MLSCSVVANSAIPGTVAPQAPLSIGILQVKDTGVGSHSLLHLRTLVMPKMHPVCIMSGI